MAKTYKVTNPRKSNWHDPLSEFFIVGRATKTGVPEKVVQGKFFQKARAKKTLLIVEEARKAPNPKTKKTTKDVKKEKTDA